eukprot:TRINITY_DN22172_c0_g1_i1.p1 TRINITY_DN22172_c0_g1~~TRINITY_DN22172_c0_g1_i1.p1  ORF type:complete len:515 (+),score=40.15 TRINITY_DN22172_c0_g1_i1:23-1546(+)
MEELNEKLGPALFGALEIYLTDLVLTCLREPIQAFGSDADYLANVEASFLLQSQIVDFRKGLRPASVLNSKVTEDTDGDANKEKRQTQPHQVLRALQLAKSLLDARLEERLRITHKKPRVLRLCDKIGVTSACEVRAFLFVVSINAGVELPTTGTVRPTAAFMARFAGMTTSEFLQFLSEERPHFKQGLIGLSDHRFKSTLSDCTLKMPREVLAALTGAAMLETEVLKIDKTSLADILQEEEDGEDEEQGDDDGRRAQGEEASAVLSDEDERQSPTTGSKPVENGEAAGFPDSPTTIGSAVRTAAGCNQKSTTCSCFVLRTVLTYSTCRTRSARLAPTSLAASRHTSPLRPQPPTLYPTLKPPRPRSMHSAPRPAANEDRTLKPSLRTAKRRSRSNTMRLRGPRAASPRANPCPREAASRGVPFHTPRWRPRSDRRRWARVAMYRTRHQQASQPSWSPPFNRHCRHQAPASTSCHCRQPLEHGAGWRLLSTTTPSAGGSACGCSPSC